jgi:alpha-L-arabinofuranosidase
VSEICERQLTVAKDFRVSEINNGMFASSVEHLGHCVYMVASTNRIIPNQMSLDFARM